MLTRRRFLYTAAAAAAAGTAAPALWVLLGRAPAEAGPPAIRYGYDRCDACGMIISDPRFASAARQGAAAFRYDDIGCLLIHAGVALSEQRATAYVHDSVSGAWLEAARAVFVRSPTLRTPMGTHLAAYADLSAARVAFPTASVVTFEALVAASLKERS